MAMLWNGILSLASLYWKRLGVNYTRTAGYARTLQNVKTYFRYSQASLCSIYIKYRILKFPRNVCFKVTMAHIIHYIIIFIQKTPSNCDEADVTSDNEGQVPLRTLACRPQKNRKFQRYRSVGSGSVITELIMTRTV